MEDDRAQMSRRGVLALVGATAGAAALGGPAVFGGLPTLDGGDDPRVVGARYRRLRNGEVVTTTTASSGTGDATTTELDPTTTATTTATRTSTAGGGSSAESNGAGGSSTGGSGADPTTTTTTTATTTESTTTYEALAVRDGKRIAVSDVKPGDSGTAWFHLRTRDETVRVIVAGKLVASDENGFTEPEVDAPGEDGTEAGELVDALRAVVWEDRGDARLGSDDAVIARGSLREVLAALDTAFLLDDVHGRCVPPETDVYAGIKWWLPEGVGNAVQTDGVRFDLRFLARPCRRVDR
jgi:hypothetical protein